MYEHFVQQRLGTNTIKGNGRKHFPHKEDEHMAMLKPTAPYTAGRDLGRALKDLPNLSIDVLYKATNWATHRTHINAEFYLR